MASPIMQKLNSTQQDKVLSFGGLGAQSGDFAAWLDLRCQYRHRALIDGHRAA
jgi:hypothetical protein